MAATIKEIQIWADGACFGNPGPGGWAAILITDKQKQLVGFEPLTTNNRMELTAVIMALKKVPAGVKANIYSDSQYITKGATLWLPKWRDNNWRKSDKTVVLNQDLWKELSNLLAVKKCIFNWVKGHSGINYNELCNDLAQQQIYKNTPDAH